MKAQAITRIFLCFLLSGSLVFETKAQALARLATQTARLV